MAKRYQAKLKYTLKEIPIKYIEVWGKAQARKLDREGITELARSIKADGLINPPLVQRISKTHYLLMSGQRRLAAMKRLRAKSIPVNIIPKKYALSLEQAKASSVVENTHRNKMSQKDIVASARLLVEAMGKKEAAKHMGVTIATLYRYLGFELLPEGLKDLVPGTVSRDDITKIFLAVKSQKKAASIAEKLYRTEPQLKKQYIKLLHSHPKKSHPALLNMARKTMIRQNVSMRLTKRAAKKLKAKSDRLNMSANDVARKILEKHLR